MARVLGLRLRQPTLIAGYLCVIAGGEISYALMATSNRSGLPSGMMSLQFNVDFFLTNKKGIQLRRIPLAVTLSLSLISSYYIIV